MRLNDNDALDELTYYRPQMWPSGEKVTLKIIEILLPTKPLLTSQIRYAMCMPLKNFFNVPTYSMFFLTSYYSTVITVNSECCSFDAASCRKKISRNMQS